MFTTINLVVPFILTITAISYLLTGIIFGAGKKQVGDVIFIISWLLSLLLFLINAFVSRAIPLGNIYHVMTFVPVCLLPIYFITGRKIKLRIIDSSFAFVPVIMVVASFFMRKNIIWRPPPPLHSPWFMPHVTAYLIAYSLLFIAFTSLISAIVTTSLKKDGSPYDNASWFLINYAFPFMTFGLCAGAIWADSAWGSFWSWDSKETGALIMWVLYFIYLQTARKHVILGRTIHFLAFMSLLITFIFINLIPRFASLLHGYG